VSNPPNNSGRIEPGLIFRLAIADLFHEWVLSLCLVLALAAVIAPLLLIFGLKFGTIETLRSRLIQDPANREIRPLTTISRGTDWFREMAGRPDVGFIIPTTRQIAASVFVKPTNSEVRVEADLIPTAENDRLLLENGSRIPKPGEVVLTALAAQELNVQAGDHVTIIATRSHGGDSERATADMLVAGTLSVRASGLKAIYAPLPFLEDVEAYKDGLAVPEFHWAGSLPIASPEYDGAIVVLPAKLSDEKRLRLVINTGFSNIDELAGDKLPDVVGWSIAPDHVIYWLSTESSTVREDSILAVRDQLRGFDAEVIPWVRPIEADVRTANTAQLTRVHLYGLSLQSATAAAMKMSPSPPWGEGIQSFLQIMLPKSLPVSGRVELSVANSQGTLIVPVTSIPGLAGTSGRAFVPTVLAGLLRLSQIRPLHFDERTGQLLLERRHYAAFRMYARTIDDVEPLRQALAAEGIAVHTEAQRIGEVVELDRNLTRIFWLIATVGVAGGVAALVASLYASVERKRRDLAVLRLIGLPASCLVRFPVYQSLLLSFGSYLVAAGIFHGIAVTINYLFRSQLLPGESFCRLPALDEICALLGALAFAVVSAILAATRVNSASPADALRAE
jgi:putative ABC transport system permease protein